jgi:hypothetical protein
MRRTVLVLGLAALGLAGCGSNTAPLSQGKAAKRFTAAYDSYLSGGRVVLHEFQLPNTAGHPEYGRPTAHEDHQAADLMDGFESKLNGIAWPTGVAEIADPVESALSEEATETRSLAGVPGTSPALGQDYKRLSATERREIAAENRLRKALGLPNR